MEFRKAQHRGLLLNIVQKDWWDQQIERAVHLASQSAGSKQLLDFYGQLLRAQKQIYESLRNRDWLPTGELEYDLPAIRSELTVLLKTVETHGPDPLATEAHDYAGANDEFIDEMILTHWWKPSDKQFFSKAFVQPYARRLVEAGVRLGGPDLTRGERQCPFCGGKPQVSFLQSKEENAESGNRDFICSRCLSSWEYRRVACASCGEERPAKIGYFHSPEFDHIRIEACDTCKHYCKGVDLTRLGFAVPLVDDVFSASLDLWAREHGYAKIEMNLVGL